MIWQAYLLVLGPRETNRCTADYSGSDVLVKQAHCECHILTVDLSLPERMPVQSRLVGREQVAASRHHCLSVVPKEVATVTDEQSTEEIFLESQRCELEMELAALKMIFKSLENGRSIHCVRAATFQSSKQDEKEDMVETSNVALKEHVPIDKDCTSLQAQLENLRMQISGIVVLRVDCQSQFSTIRSNALNP